MTLAKLLKKTVLVGPILGAVVGGAVLIGCATGSDDRGATESAVASQETSERAEDSSRGEHSRNSEQSRESGGEHGSQVDESGEGGQHNEASERGGEASSTNSLARDATFDEVRNGARLVLKFDDASNSFRGSVENVSNSVLTRVRVEIHLDNGAELGPTTPTDLAPGETLDIVLPSTPEPFSTWTTHAEIGSGEGGSGEGGGEHGSQTESNGEGGQHNEASERGGESGDANGGEAIGANSLAADAAFDEVRNGARLVLKYDDATNSFQGSVENVSNSVLTRVRVEIHLDNGAELGPTTPTDLAPGETLDIVLPSTPESFSAWTTHAEFGSGEGGGEHGAGGEGSEGSEGSEGGGESREAEMSSPITPLDETWTGVLGGMAVEASFDQATGTMHTTVRNTTGETLCFVQSEPHLKSGTRTVGELGPDVIGDLAPGQQVSTSISVDSEPSLAGVSFDGYVVHLEVFECGGPGPQPHSGEGSEGGQSREGRESSGEHGGNGESGGEHGSGGDHE